MYYLTQFLISAFATMGFTFYFGGPKKVLPMSCIFGGIAWLVYKIIILKYNNYFLSGFISAFIIGVLGESAARIMKKPATLFILPGLIPLVPGAGMYYSMYYLIYENRAYFQETAIQTFYIASSLAIGIVAAYTLTKTVTMIMKKNPR